MARALQKVTKKISKKRGDKPNNLHQNSRDAQRLRRAGAREDKLSRLLDTAVRANQIYVDRVTWFKTAIEGSSGPLTDQEMQILANAFIAREDEELAAAKEERRPGRPPSKIEERITARKETEQKEYKGGLWVPELRDEDARKKVERWEGTWGGLNALTFVRVSVDGLVKTSSFPPKSLS